MTGIVPHQPVRMLPRRATALLLAAALALGVTAILTRADEHLEHRVVVPMLAGDSATGPHTVVVPYFFIARPGDGGGPSLVPVHRAVQPTVGVARAAVEALIAGPTADEAAALPAISSAVPPGTVLRGISIAGGIATVDLSEAFAAGGGSAAVLGRLAQLVFTLTRFDTVDGVVLQVEGVTVGTFSPEGIVIDGPLTRDDFLEFVPSILVETPVYGGVAANPLRVTGMANVFEATFRVAVVDGRSGRVLAEQTVTATCGTGCWGTFDVTIPYDVDGPVPGAVVTWYDSAVDGSPRDVREYPVTLVPAP
jgi:hypothetical protein